MFSLNNYSIKYFIMLAAEKTVFFLLLLSNFILDELMLYNYETEMAETFSVGKSFVKLLIMVINR